MINLVANGQKIDDQVLSLQETLKYVRDDAVILLKRNMRCIAFVFTDDRFHAMHSALLLDHSYFML